MSTRSWQRLTRISFAVFLIPFAAGCYVFSQRADTGHGVEHNGSGIVLSGVALMDGPGSVLDAMRGKVPNFTIQYTDGNCPEIAFRNNASFRSVINPRVYVDGTRASDTCILESLRSADVWRIEVYPNGVSNHAGYGVNPGGLILLFMQS